MSVLSSEIINNLKDEDQEKVSYFIDLLLKKKEYKNLKKEISRRRSEIKKNDTLSHKDIWSSLDV
ncbi:MAG: hypothetical protein ACYTFY_20605 [Planctomycetota bacterium]